jgi:hypothetical protein
MFGTDMGIGNYPVLYRTAFFYPDTCPLRVFLLETFYGSFRGITQGRFILLHELLGLLRQY